MKFCRPLINQLLDRVRATLNERGVALFIVLTAMATLSIFLGEITYTAQINQKLAYDRLDQVKATALAKSGFRLALLRIRAYSELKKMVDAATKSASSSGMPAAAIAAASNAIAPKDMIEKIWNEPITVPFSGDLSSLPTSAKDALEKFRKDSSMEGLLYLSILSQSSRFNLNSYLPAFAPTPKPSGTPGGTNPNTNPGGTAAASPSPSANPSATPVTFNSEEARRLLTEQINGTFQKKFEEDEKFRDQYRNTKIPEIAEDIMSWNDITYDNNRTQSSGVYYKRAPFYDVSELHYLPTIDDEIYNLLAPTFTASVQSTINVNKIQEPALMALVPGMTVDERKKFFEDRDNNGVAAGGTPAPPPAPGQAAAGTGPFKEPKEFFDYLKTKVAVFGNSDTKITEFKNALTQRGMEVITDESQFLVHIEASVHQTKRTLEAVVMLVSDKSTTAGTTGAPGSPVVPNQPPQNINLGTGTQVKRSNLKVLQMRFL